MKHTLILLLVLISTKLLLAQNDTIVYYKNHAPTPSKNGADHMVVFQKKNEKKSILMAYELHNEKWKHEKTEIIKRMKDGHYSISSGTSNFTRAYKKVNGGYYVEEYNSNDKISKKGLSKTMFPLHRIGQWQKIFDDRVVGMDIFNEELMTLSYTIYHGRKLPNNIYANADTIAEYKGGDKQFAMDLARNVEYPRICQENGITGCVLVLFAIDELGKPTDIRILRKVDPYLDQAALDAIKACNKWNPAIKDGKPIKLYNVAPINFELR